MSILRTKRQIQPKWPLEVDPSVGPYKSVGGVAESLRQDFIFLLLTVPGEWPMNPELGIGLSTYLFESIEALQISDLKSNIKSQLRKYLDNISLINAEFVSSPEDRDTNLAFLKIAYKITDLGIEDEVLFHIDVLENLLITKNIFPGGAESAVRINEDIFRGISYFSKYGQE